MRDGTRISSQLFEDVDIPEVVFMLYSSVVILKITKACGLRVGTYDQLTVCDRKNIKQPSYVSTRLLSYSCSPNCELGK